MTTHGGKRQNSGRKRGSGDKPHIRNYLTEEQINEFFQNVFERAKTSDKLAAWIGDQLSGKAVQPLAGHDGGDLFGFDDEAKKRARAARRQLLG